MKKMIYLFIALVTLTTMASSCSSDNEDDSLHRSNAAEAAQGEYPGTYTRVTKGLTDAVTAIGSITIAPAEAPNTANITFTCEELEVNVTRIFNITYSNDGFAFSNHLSDDIDTKTSAIAGRIDSQRNVTTNFTLSQRSGRKTIQYDYAFAGQK